MLGLTTPTPGKKSSPETDETGDADDCDEADPSVLMRQFSKRLDMLNQDMAEAEAGR